MNIARPTIVVLATAVLLLAAGCGSLSKPYPDKSLHALGIADPPTPASPPIKSAVRVNNVHIAQPFDGSCFVYKVGESKFVTDYYSGFVATPGSLVSASLANWMAKAGIFTTVLTADNSAEYQVLLETNVSAMYGDFQPGHPPRAVVEARFFVINEASGKFDVIFDKIYRQSEEIDPKLSRPDALVKAWNDAWQRMLVALAQDLRSASAVASISAAAAQLP
jgi:uncharacterized lipoprotein YmbA